MLQARKKPKQARAKQRVAAILAAAERLLIEEDYDQFSTNLVAQKADVNIASLYQYFPNKEALIYAINRKMLDEVLDSCQRIRQCWPNIGWRQSLELMQGDFLTDQNHIRLVRALNNAIYNSPTLLTMEREHAETIARFHADFLQHYGSPWPRRTLINAGRLIYAMANVIYYELGHLSATDEKESMKLYKSNLVNFIEQALTQPKPPI